MKLQKWSGADLVRRILLGWLLAVALELLLLPAQYRDLAQLAGLSQMSLPRIVLITAAVVAALQLLTRLTDSREFERVMMVCIFAVLATLALRNAISLAFFAACLLILLVLWYYAKKGWNHSPEPSSAENKAHRAYVWILAVLSVLFFLFVTVWTVARVYSFCAPTYDFGIFSQMFYYMKETGLPLTTVERDGLLSHFAVHVSPIYYLMLPIYWLFPHPVTLQVLQAAVITSAVIPLWLIGKHYGLSGLQRLLVCVVLLLYPAFSGGTSYDIHENCFLTPLILWIFYGIIRKNTTVTLIFSLLTLMVKEDAPVYVAVIGVWLVVKALVRPVKPDFYELLTGMSLVTGALAWFLAATGYLAESGDGVMTYRYDNFMFDESSSLLTVVKAVLMNPMKAVYECVDPEKLQFIALTLLPVLGLPLLTRRYERYLLLIPYILVNLMSDYQYQHDIFFQYTFGSTAFLLFLTVANLADIKLEKRRLAALAGAVIVAASCFSSVVIPKAMYYPKTAIEYYDYYQGIRDTLSTVPDGASVTAGTFYTTLLSQRETLYDVRYCSKEHVLESEYVVLGVKSTGDVKKYATGDKNNGFENLTALLEANGYTLHAQMDGVVVIYRKS